MSTLNVANISDDQSTLSNSANPSDNLNNTTTVDTKFVTNGSAKAWAVGNAASTILRNSLNVSIATDVAGGKTTYALTSSMSGGKDYFSFSGSTAAASLDRYVMGWSANTTSSVIGVLRGNPATGSTIEGPLSWSILGELA